MHKRINVTLPERTLRLMDRVSSKGQRSSLIQEAVRRYLMDIRRRRLKRQLRQGYLRSALSDRRLAEEWLLLDEEAWQR